MREKTDYMFSNSWFDNNRAIWSQIFQQLQPAKVLEVGSYEGKSTIFIIENLANTNGLEIHCVDSWEGGIEHKEGGFGEADMSKVEARFVYNTRTALSKSSQKLNLNSIKA